MTVKSLNSKSIVLILIGLCLHRLMVLRLVCLVRRFSHVHQSLRYLFFIYVCLQLFNFLLKKFDIFEQISLVVIMLIIVMALIMVLILKVIFFIMMWFMIMLIFFMLLWIKRLKMVNLLVCIIVVVLWLFIMVLSLIIMI